MLDFADVVAINKFERRGAEDALRDVGRQLVRNREAFGKRPEDMPVFGTSAATFNDDGVTALYQHLRGLLGEHGLHARGGHAPPRRRPALLADRGRSCPPTGCATSPRSPRRSAATTRRPSELVEQARRVQRLEPWSRERAVDDGRSRRRSCARPARRRPATQRSTTTGRRRRACSGDEQVVRVREQGDPHPLTRESLSGNRIPRVALPRYVDHGELVQLLAPREPPRPLPLHRRRLPVQARERGPGPDVRRRGRPGAHQPPVQAALRGPAGRPGSRTAFDSVTLYGRDPDQRPDIYGKVGTSGVCVATLDDMKVLYDGFDLLVPDHERLDDDQRPGADGAGVLPQHRDRPAGRRCRARRSTPERTAARARSAAPCRPTSSRRTRARTPACSRTEFSLR